MAESNDSDGGGSLLGDVGKKKPRRRRGPPRSIKATAVGVGLSASIPAPPPDEEADAAAARQTPESEPPSPRSGREKPASSPQGPRRRRRPASRSMKATAVGGLGVAEDAGAPVSGASSSGDPTAETKIQGNLAAPAASGPSKFQSRGQMPAVRAEEHVEADPSAADDVDLGGDLELDLDFGPRGSRKKAPAERPAPASRSRPSKRPSKRPSAPPGASKRSPSARPSGRRAGPARSSKRPPPGSPQASSSQAGFDDFDLDDGSDLGVNFDLADEPMPSSASASQPPSSAGPRSQGGVSAPPSGPIPAYVPSFDEYDVEVIAKYGPSPITVVGAVRYAWSVFNRRKELVAELVKQEELYDRTQRECKERFVIIVDGLRKKEVGALEPYLAPLNTADKLIADQSVAQKEAEEKHRTRMADFEARLAEIAGRKKAAADVRKKALIVLEDKQQKLREAETKLRRVSEDLQRVEEEAAAAAGEGAQFAPPEFARKISVLQGEKATHQKVVGEAQLEARSAKAELVKCDKAVAEIDKEAAGVERQQKQVEEARAKAQAEGDQTMKDATMQRYDAYEAALRRAIEEVPKALPQGTYGRFVKVNDELNRAEAEIAKWRQAPDSYDRDGAVKGVAAVVGTVVGIIALIVVLATAL